MLDRVVFLNSTSFIIINEIKTHYREINEAARSSKVRVQAMCSIEQSIQAIIECARSSKHIPKLLDLANFFLQTYIEGARSSTFILGTITQTNQRIHAESESSVILRISIPLGSPESPPLLRLNLTYPPTLNSTEVDGNTAA